METMSKYSCKKASEMVEKRNLFGLSFIERIKLKMHLSVCNACKSYEKQSHLIDKVISEKQAENLTLSDASKAHIVSSLKEEI